MRTYLDHNATSPLRLSVKAAMTAAMELHGNASSIHREGREAHKLLDDARDQIAVSLGCIAPMLVFTSGGSESNNLALKGTDAERLLVAATEHPSVINSARASGKTVEIIPVTSDGEVDLDALKAMLPGPKALVSVMLANNETGVIQPVRDVVALAASHGALVHCDAVQAYKKEALNFGVLGVDLMTISAHKAGGPQGVGALIVRDGLPLKPLINGGGQELRRRAGTENLVGIAGFGALANESILDLTSLQHGVETSLEDIVVIGAKAHRLNNTSCIAVRGIPAETLLMNLDLEGCAVSSGSACSSGKVAKSHVLEAMGVAPDLVSSAIRISLGWNTTRADIHHFIAAWQRIIARLRARAA